MAGFKKAETQKGGSRSSPLSVTAVDGLLVAERFAHARGGDTDRVGSRTLQLVGIGNDTGQVALRQAAVGADAVGDEREAVGVLEVTLSNQVTLEASSDAREDRSIDGAARDVRGELLDVRS